MTEQQIPQDEFQLELPKITWPTLPPLPALTASTILDIGRRFLLYTPTTLLKTSVDEGEATMTALARTVLGTCVPFVSGIVSISSMPTQQAILLSLQPGTPLVELWPTLTPAQRHTTKANLCDLLVRMRTRNFDYIGRPGRRPYVTVSAFGTHEHAFCTTRTQWDASRIYALRKLAPSIGVSIDEPRRLALERIQRETAFEGLDRPVLTHGDLSDRNILVDPVTLDVTGFLDWEMANLAPAYFEYVAARLSGGHQPEWRAVLLDVLKSVLRRECESQDGADERYRCTLSAWDTLVDVERPAQGYDDNCYWTFDPPKTLVTFTSS